MIDASEYLLIAFFLFLSMFYSGSEAILMSIGIDRMLQLIEEGGPRSKILKFMASHTNEVLMVILIGNNLVNIIIASCINSITIRLLGQHIWPGILITSFFILVLGEIMPKIFSRNFAEKLIKYAFPVLKYNYYLFYPLLALINKVVVATLGKKANLHGRMVTEDDILYMINKAEKEKSMDSKQIELLNSILEFPTIKVKDIMIPRSRIKAIDLHSSLAEILAFIKEDNHSRYPVYDETLDNIIGFLHVKTLVFSDSTFNIQDHLRKSFYVYEHMKIQSVFDYMNRKKVHLALVRDENNLIVGVITLEDIMEEIFGEIQDEHDSGEVVPITDSEDGILVKGTIHLRDLYNDYDIKIPLNDNYSTLAGLILDILGDRFPDKGQIIVWNNYVFELIDVKDSIIYKVRIKERGEVEEDQT
jgi:CBS domain containing-hemolysin-like protein